MTLNSVIHQRKDRDMTSIAIIGGTGYAGGNIAAEAARRGLTVTAVSRLAAEVPAGVTHVRGSLDDQALVERLAADHDVVVLAVHATGEPALLELLPAIAKAVVVGGARLGVVGGAGSLLVAEGGPRLVDTPEFPAEYKAEALAHGEVLEALRADTTDLDWFYVSPAAQFGAWAPGETTGAYRTSDDVLLVDADGSSEVSGTDFALGFVDEVTAPAHRNARFTIAH
jgi:putative NADH-flavin reductase